MPCNKFSFLLGLIGLFLFVPAAAEEGPGLRALSGTVGVIDRGDQPLSIYLTRLEAAVWLETAQHTVGPYVVSIANSLEAMDDKERAGQGDRVLLRAYIMLASYAGPQAGRLAELYVAALSQLLGVSQEEATLTLDVERELSQIGGYAAAAAAARIARLPLPGKAEAQMQLALALGRFGDAAKHAQAWEAQAPSVISKTYRLGAQLLAGQKGAATGLWAIEREGGAAAAVAAQMSRQAARDTLSLRLGKALQGASVPGPVRKLAAGWRRPEAAAKGKKAEPHLYTDRPLKMACQSLLQEKAGVAPELAADCAYLLVEGPGDLWVKSELLSPSGPPQRRLLLLDLVKNLGRLLGLAGSPPDKDPAQRKMALEQMMRLLPDSGLAPDEAGAMQVVAQIAASQQPGIAPSLYPMTDKFLQDQGCSPLALPFHLGRHPRDVAGQVAALRAVLARCGAQGGTRSPGLDEMLRLVALSLVGLDSSGDQGWKVLQELAERRGRETGQGRFPLALADGEAVRLLSRKGAAPTEAELSALQKRYEDASAQLLPWDGIEAKGRAEAQIATLLLRRHQLMPRPALLQEANAHLRYAQLLAMPDGAQLVQSLEVRVARELLMAEGKQVAAPALDASKLPAGPGRRLLACELALTARAAKDNAGYARNAALFAGPPLPEVMAGGTPRLLPSLGVDERLRVALRGGTNVIVLPRCLLR